MDGRWRAQAWPGACRPPCLTPLAACLFSIILGLRRQGQSYDQSRSWVVVPHDACMHNPFMQHPAQPPPAMLAPAAAV